MDAGSITAAISGLQAATEIARSMIGVRDTATIQAKTIELQSAILAAQTSALAAQSDQFTLLQRIHELEEKVASAEAWATEKSRYHLHELREGAFTYVLKGEEGSAEPVHHLCANCYNVHHEKSLLQKETKNPGRAIYLVCHNCDSQVLVSGVQRQEHSPRAITKRPRR